MNTVMTRNFKRQSGRHAQEWLDRKTPDGFRFLQFGQEWRDGREFHSWACACFHYRPEDVFVIGGAWHTDPDNPPNWIVREDLGFTAFVRDRAQRYTIGSGRPANLGLDESDPKGYSNG